MRSSVFLLIPAVVLCLVCLPVCRADVVYVDRDATGAGTGVDWANAFTTVSSGLAASASGDELWVRAAVYNETAYVTEGVALYGGFAGTETERDQRDWTANETVIDATGQETSAVTCLGSTILDGFTVRHGSAARGGGVYSDGESVLVANCRIEENEAISDGGGVAGFGQCIVRNCVIANNRGGVWGGGVKTGFDWLLENCLIVSNHSDTYGGGVFATRAVVRDCTMALNTAPSGGGIFISWPARITGCLIAANRADRGGGIFVSGGNESEITHCTIVNNEGIDAGSGLYRERKDSLPFPVLNCIFWNRGVEISDSVEQPPPSPLDIRYCAVQGGLTGEGNIDAYPDFVDPDGWDWRLADGSPCIDAGTDMGRPFNGSAPDIGAYEASGDFVGGDGIHVPETIYVAADAPPGGDGRSWAAAFFSIGKALDVSTTLDEIWVKAGRYAEKVVMESGVTLLGGFGGTEESRDTRDWVAHETVIDATGLGGSAVVAADLSVLDGFTVTGGDAAYGGGVYSGGARFILRNCAVRGNRAGWGGGAFVGPMSVLEISGCRFAENQGLDMYFLGPQRAGGLACTGAQFDIQASIFERNTGAGLFVEYSLPCRISNCIFTRNDDGGIVGEGFPGPDQLEINNCTVVENTAETGPAGIKIFAGGVRLTNSILWNGDSDDPTGLDIEYSCVRGLIYTTFERIEDPMFVDPAADDWRLQEGSPLVDAGDPAAQWNDACLPPGRGSVRNDMGAYGGPGNCDIGLASGVPWRYAADINGDGKVDERDLFQFMTRWRTAIEP